jgi:AAA domain
MHGSSCMHVCWLTSDLNKQIVHNAAWLALNSLRLDHLQAGAAKAAESVRVSTVDNYQGEEADIVLVSLVRSNDSGAIGFLKEPQRVNMLLSRAKLGLILIGNSETLLAGSRGRPTWQTVFEHAPRVAALPARCEKHGTEGELCSAEDFTARAADGGCAAECGAALACGHVCSLKCHSSRLEHAPCREPVKVKCAAIAHSTVTLVRYSCLLFALSAKLLCPGKRTRTWQR